jgi:leader peptidase (prepilin peptidase)/N-methyltransferase
MDLRSTPVRLATTELRGWLRPAVAVATCLAVLLALARFGPSARTLGAAFLLCVVAALAVVDLEQRRIPNRIVLPATTVVLAAQFALDPRGTPLLIAIALASGLFFYLPLLVSPGGMGMGDVKLAVLLGAALGQGVVLAIAVAVLGAFLVAVTLLVRDGARARKSAIAYGPFLALGAAVAILLG